MNTHTPETPSQPAAGEAGPHPLYTAAQIATALGRNRASLYRVLRKCSPDGALIISGKETSAWHFRSLPGSLQSSLYTEAVKEGYSDPEKLLTQKQQPWQSPVPLKELTSEQLDKAAKLREAFAWALHNVGNAAYSLPALRERGLEDYRRVFRYSISAKQWTRLLDRFTTRDRGANDWQRLELYLDDSIQPRRRKPSASTFDFSGLRPVLALAENPAKPTPQELTLIWQGIFLEYECQIKNCSNPRKLKKHLIDWLDGEPVALAKNRRTLDQLFRKKWKLWQESGRNTAVLKDGRVEKKGESNAPQLPEEDRLLLIARSLNCGGRISQAWRELWAEGRLPDFCYESYSENPENKSYVPPRIRRVIASDVERLLSIHQGKKEAKLKGPKVVRDWSGMPSGVQTQSDDATLPVYFWIEDPGSKAGCKLMRGQFLPWIDTRTTYIHCFQLIAREAYSSIDILRGLVHLNDVYGLPEELYFERGIWEKSLLIKGRSDELGWNDRVCGLADLGIKVIHALDPSAKVVERVLGALQNRMERERGYAGREERKDRPEHITKAMQLVNSGKAHPSQYFYSYKEWVERLNAICDEYNDDPQNGKMLQGASPRQAFVELLECPPARLDAQTRYLVATNRRHVKVTAQGISIKIGKNTFLYRSEATGERIGETVVAWFNVEDHECITITDMSHKDPVTIPQATAVPAYRSDRETIAQAKRECAQHASYISILYSNLRKVHACEFANRQARTVAGRDTLELGEAMREQQAAAKKEMTRDRRLARRLRQKELETGFVSPRGTRNAERRLKGLKLLEEADRLEAQAKGQAGS